MKARRAMTAVLAVLPLLAAADADVRGKIVNKTSGELMDFVNIQLIDPATGKGLPIGTQSDMEGGFILPGVKSGKYILRVSNLGSTDLDRNITVGNHTIDLGELQLADDAKVLDEVVVEGVRSQMRFELDKKVFTVDANIAAAGQSASELLESIPSVEVDQDGEVSLRGNTSVTVWINGKDSGLTADNRAQILEQIPAETIERVEVITNPSAKYSPEGTAGIINIVLKKDRKGGYFGSAEIGGNSRGGANASVNFNYNSSKWEAYASVGFRMRHNKGGSLMRRTLFDENDSYLNSDGSSRNHGNNIFVRLGGTYHISDFDAISLSGFGMFGHRWGNSTTDYRSNIPGQWIANHEYSTNKSDNRGAHGELMWQHKWSDDHTLDVSVGFNYWGGPNWNDYLHEETYADDTEEGHSVLQYQQQDQTINVKSWEVKVDYAKTFNQYLKLEAGFNGNYNKENTPVSLWQGDNVAAVENAYQNNLQPQYFNRFIYDNNISALYFTLGGRVKNFSYSAGLRGEAWQIRTKSLGYGETADDLDWYKKSRIGLFPSAYLSYSLPYDNEIQLNYTRRIRRPWGGQLNSFMDVREAASRRYGNPELNPQFSNSFELNYIKTFTNHMLSVSAYLRTEEDQINDLSYMSTLDGKEYLFTTFANVGRTVNSGVEIVGKNSLFRSHLDLTTTVNLYNNNMKAWNYDLKTINGDMVHLSGKSRNSFAWDARIMANVRLPWQLSLQATGRYASSQLMAQGSRQGGWSVDAGLRRVFGNWSVSLNVRDIFDSRKFKNTIESADYTQRSERWRGGRTFRLTIKYSFGNMRGNNKQRQQNSEPIDGSGYSEEM